MVPSQPLGSVDHRGQALSTLKSSNHGSEMLRASEREGKETVVKKRDERGKYWTRKSLREFEPGRWLSTGPKEEAVQSGSRGFSASRPRVVEGINADPFGTRGMKLTGKRRGKK